MPPSSHSRQPITLGLIVNPLAGIGGPAALKGSDDRQLVARALAEGAEARAVERGRRCLAQLGRLLEQQSGLVGVVTCPGDMGASVVRDSGFDTMVLPLPEAVVTCAADTQSAATHMLARGVDLLLFVGGDGTARDICAVVGESLPVLGIPAGVKMHSGVFAITPEAAAEVVCAMMAGRLVDVRLREVRDIDEAALRVGLLKSRYFGDLLTPEFGHFVQGTKQGGREVEALVQDDIAADICERMEEGVLYLMGAGTTTGAIAGQLGVPSTLLGVDAVLNGERILADGSAAQLEKLLKGRGGRVVIIVSVTGGQGSLFGRGNQQFSASVLRRAGRENVWALATKTKIQRLQGRPLLLDSNDTGLDRDWAGYIAVTTGYRDQILYPLGDGFAQRGRD